MFENKILMITGGTGSFGNAVLERFLNSGLREIRIFSRDEKKQDDMRRKFANEKLKFYLGDVRDPQSIVGACKGVDYLFHAAALKQVPSCEFFPLEAVKTNIIGTDNVLEAAIQAGVQRVVCLSTDKAVYPINAMGISKAMMEKVIVSKSRLSDKTVICTTRYGNVMGSRGSVIPLFMEQIKSGRPITVTDPKMTRFMMTLDQAVDLVLFAFENGRSGDIFVQKSPAATIQTLAKAMIAILGANAHPIDIIGTRHGEKRFEVLMSREEAAFASDLGDYYCIPPDNRDLNYGKYFDQGNDKALNAVEYTSDNTTRLDLSEMESLLSKLKFTNNILHRKQIESGI